MGNDELQRDEEGRIILGPDPVTIEVEIPPEIRDLVGSREEGRPGTEPAPDREGRHEEGRDDESSRERGEGGPLPRPTDTSRDVSRPRAYDPNTANPSRLHGARDRIRQDDGLGRDEIVERTIRNGIPEGGWEDFEAKDGLQALYDRKEQIGAESKGINLLAGHAERVDPQIVRELSAGTIPARLVRR